MVRGSSRCLKFALELNRPKGSLSHKKKKKSSPSPPSLPPKRASTVSPSLPPKPVSARPLPPFVASAPVSERNTGVPPSSTSAPSIAPPPSMTYAPPTSNEKLPLEATFRTGLCDCFADLDICFFVFCCTCCSLSRNSVDLDGAKRTCLNTWYCCCYPASIRKNRFQALATFGVKESCCKTCCIVNCCGICSECQIAREIKREKGTQSRVIVANNAIVYRRQEDNTPDRIEMTEY
jgi:Cys-rich protein (TIGR01571 family)